MLRKTTIFSYFYVLQIRYGRFYQLNLLFFYINNSILYLLQDAYWLIYG